MDRDSQLEHTVELLEEHGVEHWLDAGSLLGIIRDGDLMPWDPDIDLSCWDDQLPALESLSRSMRRAGDMTVIVRRYRDDVYKVKLRPGFRQLRRGMRTIDISVFRQAGDVAWCPIDCVQPLPRRRFSPRWFVEKPFRELVIKPWERRPDRTARTTRIPRLELDVRTWLVPVEHYRDLEERSTRRGRLRVPGAPESYLTLRYGDWRQPQASWNYCTDDGLLDPRPPDRALDSG